METKSIAFNVKDIDKTKRTAVTQFAAYGNLDRDKDRSNYGMLKKSISESFSDIRFFLNHDKKEAPGKPLRVWEQTDGGFAESKFGTHTLGEDCLKMMDEGIITDNSFGFETLKSEPIQGKGRDLKEVKLWEYSILTHWGANPLSKVVSVTKEMFDNIDLKTLQPTETALLKDILISDHTALEKLVSLSAVLGAESDLYTWIMWNISQRTSLIGDIRGQIKWNSEQVASLKSHVLVMEKFTRNTTASDECIKSVAADVKEIKNLITIYDTASTQLATEPEASDVMNVIKQFSEQLKLN